MCVNMFCWKKEAIEQSSDKKFFLSLVFFFFSFTTLKQCSNNIQLTWCDTLNGENFKVKIVEKKNQNKNRYISQEWRMTKLNWTQVLW